VKIAIRRMGNSQGVLIPKPVLRQVGLEKEAELKVEKDCIILRKPRGAARSGWAEASRKIAGAADDALVWPEFGNADDAELKW